MEFVLVWVAEVEQGEGEGEQRAAVWPGHIWQAHQQAAEVQTHKHFCSTACVVCVRPRIDCGNFHAVHQLSLMFVVWCHGVSPGVEWFVWNVPSLLCDLNVRKTIRSYRNSKLYLLIMLSLII
jgi:hypothetical protein